MAGSKVKAPLITTLFLLTLAQPGCQPWYKQFEIRSQQELYKKTSFLKLEAALLSTKNCSGPLNGCGYRCAQCALDVLLKGGEAAVPTMAKGMSNDDWHVRYSTVDAMKIVGGKKATEILLYALGDEKAEVRVEAANALAEMGRPKDKIMAAIDRMLRVESDPVVRKAVAKAKRRLLIDVLTKKKIPFGRRIAKKRKPNNKSIAVAGRKKNIVVALFDINNVDSTVSDSVIKKLDEYLATKLTQTCGYRVVPKEQLKSAMIEEKRNSYKQCYDKSCQIELGKAVAAQKTVATKIMKLGENCVITSIIYDLKTETTEAAASVKTRCTTEKLFEGIEKICQQFR